MSLRSTVLPLVLAFSTVGLQGLLADDTKDSKDKSKTAASDAKTVAKPEDNRDYSERFDLKVREDLFDGFQGDKEALKRGMQACEDTLAEEPEHAEALVWRGAARVFLSGEAFQKGDPIKGMGYWTTGLEDMDKAVELEPDNIGVLIPRAAVLLPAGRSAPRAMGLPLLHRVKTDLERTYERQKDMLDQLGEHPLGELRMGLADVYRALGEQEKSKEQLLAVRKELPESPYAERAEKWLQAGPNKKLGHSCIGCHSN